jgi:hypothetical protein
VCGSVVCESLSLLPFSLFLSFYPCTLAQHELVFLTSTGLAPNSPTELSLPRKARTRP